VRAFVTGGSGFLGRRLIRELVVRGYYVRALARSAQARQDVAAAGAEPAEGDLDDQAALARAMEGMPLVIHAAALAKEWAPLEDFERVNVRGTENLLAAARQTGVKRIVHVSTEAVLLDGRPLVRVDEREQASPDAYPGYPRTKAISELAVLAANGPSLETVVVRPRFIWGEGDTTLLPAISAKVRAGKFAWIAGGRSLSSTCHVVNCCEGTILAAEKGTPGEVYFLTDGEPVEFRAFLTEMLGAAGVKPGDASVPFWLARAFAWTVDGIWRGFGLSSEPPVTRVAVSLLGREVTVVDDKARRELGYRAEIDRATGMRRLAESLGR